MPESPSVLLLDDGELDDVQKMLDGLEISFGRVRGGAIARGTPPPKDLLIATPRRINVVKSEFDAGAADPPQRVVIVNEDSNTLRDHLRKVGFDFLVRRPVHPEALRLLILHCLYRGEEKRRDPRVAVGFEISFRAGLLNRKATLADLSVRGCRLLSHTRFEVGKRIKLQIRTSTRRPATGACTAAACSSTGSRIRRGKPWRSSSRIAPRGPRCCAARSRTRRDRRKRQRKNRPRRRVRSRAPA
jgi:hypothetical protein